jgi:hypothetical protein
MPITYSIGKDGIFTRVEGVLSFEGLLQHIAAKREAGIMNLPEIFDVRGATLDLSVYDLRTIAGEVEKALQGSVLGRIAVVTDSEDVFGLSRSYGNLNGEGNPDFETFYSLIDARSWIHGGQPHS